jgi:hypothetical protein
MHVFPRYVEYIQEAGLAHHQSSHSSCCKEMQPTSIQLSMHFRTRRSSRCLCTFMVER